MKRNKPVLGLTMGDPAGIGPEICLAALGSEVVKRVCIPVLFGDAEILRRVAGHGFKNWEDAVITLPEFEVMDPVKKPCVVDCRAVDARKVRPGRIAAACGRASYAYIESAVRQAMAGRIQGVVTAPIHKESLNLSGVKHPGHTEIFTALTGARRSCMMLYSDVLTVTMVTTHVGYVDAPGKLTVERILAVIELTAQAMRAMLGREPRLGVCGLNPHAGEHGLFGRREEERLVAPAVRRARLRKIKVEGPLVPDAVFTTHQRKRYDAVVTLYHDQGHIPFKMLAFDTGVNLTLGLPIVRTSVDHGTAFDIAWKGKADPGSMFSAVKVAALLASRQKTKESL